MMDLRLALTELIANSVHSRGGPIQVRVWSEGASIRGEVRDDGAGAESLRQRPGRSKIRLRMMRAMTREWGIRDETAWFVV
jgi:anti-sigma regulatory factor (Ser/Thr protein kinase)